MWRVRPVRCYTLPKLPVITGEVPILLRRVTRRIAATAIATALAGATLAMTASPHQRWVLKLAIQYLPPGTNHSQYVTVLVNGRTAWFFGGSNLNGRGVPEVQENVNGRWRTPALPSGLHTWFTGASAVSANDIWALTFQDGRVVHWNGAAWSARPRGRWSLKAQFTGIVAVGPNNVWLFGARGLKRAGAGTWHLSGTKWTQVRGMAADIARASAVSPTDMWGIGGIQGSMNALLRFKNSRWVHETPSALAGFHYSYVLALGPRNVWVAGSVAGSPELGHYNGSGWTALSMPGFSQASSMCRDGRGGLWVVANPGFGASTVLDRSARGNWTSAPVSSTSADEVLACALVPRSTATWGAGKASAPQGTAAAAFGFGKVP